MRKSKWNSKRSWITGAPCYRRGPESISRPNMEKRQKPSIMQSTKIKRAKVPNEHSNDTFRHGAVRLFNSLLPPASSSSSRETFLCLLFKSIKIWTFLHLHLIVLCMFPFNDDSPIQTAPVSYVYRFFNISPHHHQWADAPFLWDWSEGCGWHFAVSEIIREHFCIQRKFYISVSINFKCSSSSFEGWRLKYFMEYGFELRFMSFRFRDEWMWSTEQKRCSIW